MSGVEGIAGQFGALAAPQRIQIVRLLLAACHQGGLTVGQIQRELRMPGSTLNHHLERLKRAGLIECRRDGQRIWCEANNQTLRAMVDFLYQECCTLAGDSNHTEES